MKSAEDMWKERCLCFAEALVDIMDGMPDYYNEDDTHLPRNDWKKVVKARNKAVLLLESNNQGEPL